MVKVLEKIDSRLKFSNCVQYFLILKKIPEPERILNLTEETHSKKGRFQIFSESLVLGKLENMANPSIEGSSLKRKIEIVSKNQTCSSPDRKEGYIYFYTFIEGPSYK